MALRPFGRHRRDLIQGRSDKEVLELRRDAELSREIATRLVEQYRPAMLGKRGLPGHARLALSYLFSQETAGGVAPAIRPRRRRCRFAYGRGRRDRSNPPARSWSTPIRFLKALTVRDFQDLGPTARWRPAIHRGGCKA